MDIIDNGLNDWFCELLGIKQTTFLTKTHTVPYKKLAVLCPVMKLANERSFRSSWRWAQGDYSKTSYSLIGTGRFYTNTRSKSPRL